MLHDKLPCPKFMFGQWVIQACLTDDDDTELIVDTGIVSGLRWNDQQDFWEYYIMYPDPAEKHLPKPYWNPHPTPEIELALMSCHSTNSTDTIGSIVQCWEATQGTGQ